MPKDQRTNWDKVKWTKFEEASFDGLMPMVEANKEHVRVFLNSIYQVQLEWLECPHPFGRTAYLSIKTRDKQPRHDWRELQRIKNELIGSEVEAMELYPAESRLVDTANQFHLFCFPELETEDGRFPFGFDVRIVSEGSAPGIATTGRGSRQRDFRPELKPIDTIRGDALDRVVKKLSQGDGNTITMGRCPSDGTSLVYAGDVDVTFGDKKTTTGRLECLAGKHVFFCAKKGDVEQLESESKET